MTIPPTVRKPTKQEIAAAYGKTLPDLIGPGLKVLFCGINPSLYSAAVGHHLRGRAIVSGRRWPRQASPTECCIHRSSELLERGYGITNLAGRATAQAAELTAAELVVGGAELVKKVKRYGPAFVAFLGVSAYRTAFGRKQAPLGLQPERVGEAGVWVLPSPRG